MTPRAGAHQVRRVPLPFPKSILIETSSLCNGHCVFCPYPLLRRGRPPVFLPKEAIKSLFHEIANHDVTRLALFCNNEPLMDHRLPDLIRLAKSICPAPELHISTNGSLLTPEKAINLFEAGLDTLSVTVPTLDADQYFNLMGFDLASTLECIEQITHTPAGTILLISTPLTYAFDGVLMTEYWAARGLKVATWSLEYKDSWGIPGFEELRGPYTDHDDYPCDRPMDQACVLADGQLVLCCRDWTEEVRIGSVLGRSLEELWTSERMRRAQEAIGTGAYGQIPVCRDCSQNPLSSRALHPTDRSLTKEKTSCSPHGEVAPTKPESQVAPN